MSTVGQLPEVQPQVFLPNPAWYAIQTHSQREKFVAHHLNLRGIANYLPVYSETHRWSDRKKRVELPLFPGYLFVNIFATNENRVRVLSVPGAAHFVGPKNDAAVITDGEIGAIQTLITREITWTDHPFLETGMRVRIHGGPLDGTEGLFLKRKSKDRLVISIQALQRSLAVVIDGSYGVEILDKSRRTRDIQ